MIIRKLSLWGSHPTILPNQVLKQYHFIDYVLRGEAEGTISKFVEALEKKKDLRDIDGLSFREGGEVKHNKLQKFIDDLCSGHRNSAVYIHPVLRMACQDVKKSFTLGKMKNPFVKDLRYRYKLAYELLPSYMEKLF